MMMMGSSPKILYTAFLLGLIREYFGLVMEKDIGEGQIERGFTLLVSFCPDKNTREQILGYYADLTQVEGDKRISKANAAIMSAGLLIDYLSEALDLTESSEGAFL